MSEVYMIKEALVMGASIRLVELNDNSAHLLIGSIKVTRVTQPNLLLNSLRQEERLKVKWVRF